MKWEKWCIRISGRRFELGVGFQKIRLPTENWFCSETLSLMGLYWVKVIGLKPLI